MTRTVLAACAVLLTSFPARAADRKPLWELEAVSPGGKFAAPGWLGFSPDGTALITVTVRHGAGDPSEYNYTLRVWDAATRKERFTADLGRGRTQAWGDELVSFPSPDAILTGGQSLVVRDLLDGRERSTIGSGGNADHAVWAVPDVQETFHLRRDPDREGKPIELLFRSSTNTDDEFSGRRFRGDIRTVRQTEVAPPQPGMRPQSVALNPARTRLVAAFRDESPSTGRPRHALTLYRIKTIGEFELDPVAIATNPHGGTVSALAFARDGKTLATGGEDGSVSLWDVGHAEGMWKPRATVTGPDHRVVAVAFSPDWRTVAAITWDTRKPNLWLIDADTGTLIRSVTVGRELTTVAWSPDGTTLLTGGYSGKLCAWDAAALMRRE